MRSSWHRTPSQPSNAAAQTAGEVWGSSQATDNFHPFYSIMNACRRVLTLFSGAVEICVALSVCNLPVLIPALAAREEREKFEGTRTGFSFGRETTVLSTLNAIHMHLEPGLEESFRSTNHQEFTECKCSGNPSFPSSNGGECCSPCSSRKAYAL